MGLIRFGGHLRNPAEAGGAITSDERSELQALGWENALGVAFTTRFGFTGVSSVAIASSG
jgi:hypothetical protein